MSFLKLAFKNLLRRKVRTALTIVSVAIAVSILFSLVAFNVGYEREMKKELGYLGYHILIVPKGCPYEAASLVLHGGKFPRYLQEAYIEKIKKVEGIDKVSKLFMDSEVNPKTKETKIYFGIDKEFLEFKRRWKFKEGGFFKDLSSIFVGSYVAETKNLKIGDRVNVLGEELTLTGILDRMGDQDDGFYFMHIKTLTRLSNKEGTLVAIPLKVRDLSKIEEISEKLRLTESEMNVVSMKEVTGTIMGLVSSTRVLILAVVLISTIIGGVGVLNTILMSVFERIRELGMMKAVGASRIDVFKLIWIETLIICTTGGVLGCIIAIIGSGAVEKFIRKVMPYAPSGHLISLNPLLFFVTIIFAVLIGIIAGFYPAYRAANLKPIEAIRTE